MTTIHGIQYPRMRSLMRCRRAAPALPGRMQSRLLIIPQRRLAKIALIHKRLRLGMHLLVASIRNTPMPLAAWIK